MATPIRSRSTTSTTRPKKKNPRAKIAVRGNRGIKIIRSCTINRPAAELFAFWRNFENIPRLVEHPMNITRKSDLESHWSVSAPPGKRRVEWDAVIINEHPDELIAWRSREGADVANAGTIRFEPITGGTSTKVKVQLEYDPPGGKLAALVAKLTGKDAGQQVSEALRGFKKLMESGESSAARTPVPTKRRTTRTLP